MVKARKNYFETVEIPGLNQILDFQRYTCKQLGESHPP